MSRRRTCCCGAGCWEFLDDFQRASIGDDYWHPPEDYTGDWSIVLESPPDENRVLRESGTPGALIVCKKRPEKDPEGLHASVQLIAPYAVGQTFRLIVGHPSPSEGTFDKCVVIQLEILDTDPLKGRLKAGVGAPGPGGEVDWGGTSYDLLLGATEGAPEVLSICVQSDERFLYKTSSMLYYLITGPFEPSELIEHYPTYVALGNGADFPVEYDDLQIVEHYNDDDRCPPCNCACNGYTWPATLLATIVNKNGCTRIDGEQFYLRYSLTECFWEAEQEIGWGPGWDDIPEGTVRPVLQLASAFVDDDPKYWILLQLNGNADPNGFWVQPLTADCHPCNLTFGPFYWEEGAGPGAFGSCEGIPEGDEDCPNPDYDRCAGQWYLVITEPP